MLLYRPGTGALHRLPDGLSRHPESRDALNLARIGDWTRLRHVINGVQKAINDGALAEDGLLPGFIQWPGGHNPAKKLPESGTRLRRLTLQHPQPDAIGQIIDPLGIDGPVEVRPGPANLIFEMQTNAGEPVRLSSASV